MATVLRVRRKRTTDPAESLVFALNKKARTTSEGDTAADVGSGGGAASKSSGAAGVSPSSPSSPTGDGKKVFKFAGTVGRKVNIFMSVFVYFTLDPPFYACVAVPQSSANL